MLAFAGEAVASERNFAAMFRREVRWAPGRGCYVSPARPVPVGADPSLAVAARFAAAAPAFVDLIITGGDCAFAVAVRPGASGSSRAGEAITVGWPMASRSSARRVW